MVLVFGNTKKWLGLWMVFGGMVGLVVVIGKLIAILVHSKQVLG